MKDMGLDINHLVTVQSYSVDFVTEAPSDTMTTMWSPRTMLKFYDSLLIDQLQQSFSILFWNTK